MGLLNELAAQGETAVAEDKIYKPVDGAVSTGLYPAKVKMAYISKRATGELVLDVEVELSLGDDKTWSVKDTHWMTASAADGGSKFKTVNGVKLPITGYGLAQSLAFLATDGEQNIDTFATEPKMVNTYDFDAGKDVPVEREVLVGLINRPILAGVTLNERPKRAKVNGVWQEVEGTKNVNKLNRYFHARSRQTQNEAVAQGEALFVEQWLKDFPADYVKSPKKSNANPAAAAAGKVGNAPANAFGTAQADAPTPAAGSSMFAA